MRRSSNALLLTSTLLISWYSVAHSEARAQDDAPGGRNAVVGSWIAQVVPNSPDVEQRVNLTTFHRGGTLINSDPDPDIGTGHGAWTRTESGEFAFTFITLLSPDHPDFPNARVTVKARLTMDDSGDAAEGPFTTEIKTADGAVVSFEGEASLERIHAE